ncbi:MAG: twin-arginine translocation signal domain-containing protein [Mariniphaga sp.]|nr:twin-arginine translocation signal domain-containing protein [Mariniphaga sp.]
MKSTNNNRRDFLKTAGLGVAALSIPLGVNAKNQTSSTDLIESLDKSSLNGFDFEFKFAGEYFLGLGEIKTGGISLRSNRLPMFAQVTTPEAIELVNARLVNKTINKEGITLDFSVQKQLGNTMEWMLHTVRNRRNMTDWTKGPEDAPDTRLTMKIEPVTRKIGKISAKGFSYQYLFKSESLAIYKITDRASWEIGGSAIGNELWMRNGVVESVVKFAQRKDFYSTEWYLPGIANPNIFQFHPLQTHFQGFTFTSSKEGTLVTFPGKVSHIRSLFEKWRGANEIVHFHEHCNDLAKTFETSPVEVLWIPGQLDRVGRANLYNDIREMVHEELHQQIGMKRERISTYGVIEEWGEPDFDRYTSKGVPKLLEAGVKTIFIPSQCQNDMNVWGVSNMCCNVDFKIAEVVGEDKLKKFCQAVKMGGAHVEMWGNTAISSLTARFMDHDGRPKGIQFLPEKGSIMEVIRKAESPFVRNASNAIEADHYTPRFCALNLRDQDIRNYWLKQWKYFHDELGIEGIFLDSSFNMSSDKFHHAQFDESKNWGGATLDQKDVTGKMRPASEPPKLIQSQYHAHLSLIAQMQKDGYHYCGEDMGVFGINRTGPDMVDRISSLPLWTDCYCDFNEANAKKAGFEPMDIFFKGLSYRIMWKMYWDIKKDKLELGTSNPLAYKLLKVFNLATEYMYNREILADEKGVIYQLGKTSVLWAFEDFDFSQKNIKSIINMLDGSLVNFDEKDSFKASGLVVYKIVTA